ncbi:MAG: hypothetical protein ACRCY8_13310 [Dermatophilaceae bacterium]
MPGASEDERAVARYRYLLRTASPEQLEAVHAEAFARLTPEQRQQVLRELTESAPGGERPASAAPHDLARAATRAEMRQPGYLQSTMSRRSPGMGGVFAGSMLGTVAGVVVGSMIASTLLSGFDSSPEAAEAGEAAGASDGATDTSPTDSPTDSPADPTDSPADAGGYDSGGWDAAGGGDFGGDVGGGGDFGGF